MADGEQQRQLVVVQLAVETALARRAGGRERHEFLGEREAARFAAQQVERTVAGDGREPRFRPVGHALEGPQRQRLHQRMLDGILGDGDAAGAEPPRQGRDQPARRIARQRIDEPVDTVFQGQPAAARAWVISSIGRISAQLVGARAKCGHSLVIASASARSLASSTK